MNPWGMDCNELVELVTDYLEGMLGADDRANFEKHLSLCGSCGTYLDQMRLTMRAMGGVRLESISPEALEAFRAAFRQWKKA
jgi:predicted anti-sigma-YlaC factor YlaD